MRPEPPCPSAVAVYATLRDDAPVAHMIFTDVTGDQRALHITPEMAMQLVVDLAAFCRQVGVAAHMAGRSTGFSAAT